MSSRRSPQLMLSERELDCLTIVESLNRNGWPARIVDIALNLKVKPPTVVELVERLVQKSLLEKGPGGAKTSERGKKSLRNLHRSHRIFEAMFVKIGLPPETACRESKKIDRYVSKEVTSAICSFLGHPRACPDKMPIEPDPECCKVCSEAL